MKQIRSLLVATTTTLAIGVGADEYNHRYKANDKVDLWVNKVSKGPSNGRLRKEKMMYGMAGIMAAHAFYIATLNDKQQQQHQ